MILAVKHTLPLLLFLGFLTGTAQEIMAPLDSRVPLKADTFVGLDEFQNLYYISNNVLFKKSDKEVISYSNIALGKLSSVNIQNPFKLILFFADFNAVIILDNKLNELSEKIDFTSETLFNNVRFVTGSSQNNIWLYADDNKLHLYDYKNLSERTQTQAMTFYESSFNPRDVIGTFKNVWILSDSGVLQFNEYGNYIGVFEQKGIEAVYPFQKGFIFRLEASFFYHNSSETRPVLLSHEQDIKGISVNNSHISIYDGEYVNLYKLNI